MRRILLLAFFGTTVIPSSAESPSDYVKRFENTYRRATTLRAKFLERYSEQGRLTRAESGVVSFRRPGKMRWEYEAPEKNLFLVDGKTAWFYVPADHTVTRVPARQSEDWRTPLALLAGEVKVSRICENVTIEDTAESPAENVVVLRCPLKQAEKRRAKGEGDALTGASEPDVVRLALVKDTGELRSVLIHDRGGILVEFQFANWEFNPPIQEKSFHFAPPDGVAIVNGGPQ